MTTVEVLLRMKRARLAEAKMSSLTFSGEIMLIEAEIRELEEIIKLEN